MGGQKVRIALAQINTTVGDLSSNAEKIISFARQAASKGADIVSFPELAVTGYPPEDLLFKKRFVGDNIKTLTHIASSIKDVVAVVGFADKTGGEIFNAAAIIYKGEVLGVYHKAFLPNYGVFDEKRYFSAGKAFPVFGLGSTVFGVNICEDIWHLNGPAGMQAYKGAKLIININASPYHMGKGRLREDILKKQAKKHKVFISYTNLVGGQDELVFDGSSLILDDDGKVLARASSFKEDLLVCDVQIPESRRRPKKVFKISGQDVPGLCSVSIRPHKQEAEEVYDALVLGLRDYIVKNGFKKVVLGLSGGIDSSLVACIAADGVGAENVVGLSMPSVFTSHESKEDAELLAKNLGIGFREIPIQGLFEEYINTLKSVFDQTKPDVTEENLQARIRGNIIMAFSNKFGYLAVNTGNKSEVSCGYCTLYGDMAGGFGVIKDVPKMLVYKLCEYRNKKSGRHVIPQRVFQKAPSAELRIGQKDSDTLPEYHLLDRILKFYIEEDKGASDIVRSVSDKDTVRRVIAMVDLNEYKRRQSAPGIKITPRAFGRDRRMPITNRYR